MAGKIIEIWRRTHGAPVPAVFTVGSAPKLLVNGEQVPMNDGDLVVLDISLRELGSIGASRLNQPVFVVSFQEGQAQRCIPSSDVYDIAYSPKD